jgi:hypothetical protein
VRLKVVKIPLKVEELEVDVFLSPPLGVRLSVSSSSSKSSPMTLALTRTRRITGECVASIRVKVNLCQKLGLAPDTEST